VLSRLQPWVPFMLVELRFGRTDVTCKGKWHVRVCCFIWGTAVHLPHQTPSKLLT
jgi:hypothetical protein